MSRIGKLPITIPNGVTVEKKDGNAIFVKGPKGELNVTIHPRMDVAIEGETITVTRKSESKTDKSLHGLSRTLIANMISGVTEGFSKRLEIQGVGYRVNLQGRKAVLSLGYSHPIEFTAPEGVDLALDEEKKNVIIVSGADKQMVGQVAAKIRSYRKPEPYKGKGIRYEDEYVQRKVGKAAAAKAE